MSSAPSEVEVFDTDFSASQPLSIRERVIVAPCSGRFKPLPPEVFTAEGEWVEAGQAVAEVLNGSDTATVRSAFSGWMMGMLALPGQPVKAGEAVFWLWNSQWDPR